VDQAESLNSSKDYTKIEKEMFVKLGMIQSVTNFMFSSLDFWYDDYNHFFTPEKVPPRFPSDTCMPFAQKMFVTVNGKILGCERIGHEYELGWVTPESIKIDFPEIVDKYNAWHDKIRKKCQVCYIFNQCSQCMFYLDLTKENPVCDRFKDFNAYSKYAGFFFDYFEKRPGLFDRILKEVLIG